MEYSNRENINLIEKIKEHAELIAALIAGIFILLAWRLDINEQTTASVLLYIIAFCVGGFAKAKEGIEETIEERKLNVELLMVLAAIGSAAIGYWTEGAILIFIFAVSGALETYAMNKSQREISALMKLQPEEAWLVRGGFEPMKVAVSTLQIGDHLLIKPGERIPADGVIFKGQSSIDESAISGESLPISKQQGDEVFAGTVNLNGAITIEMTKPNSETLFQKLFSLCKAHKVKNHPHNNLLKNLKVRM